MKTALLVIDMQNFFADMVVNSMTNVLKLSEHFRKTDQLQVFTAHGHSASELRGETSNQLVKKWGAGGSIERGSEDWKLLPEILNAWEQAGGGELIHKNTYDAFINTNLEDVLRKQGIERVVVCGVMTDCCCDTTARSAFNRGFETWLVSDACGSANKKQHEAGLRGFGFAFGEVIDTAAVLKRLTTT